MDWKTGKQSRNDEGELEFQVTWLERCSTTKRAPLVNGDANEKEKEKTNRYQFCKQYPGHWIGINSVIVFGLDMQMTYHKKTGKAILELNTPMFLLKKLRTARNAMQTLTSRVR